MVQAVYDNGGRWNQTEGHPRKTWWDGVREYMKSFDLSREDARDWNK